MRAFRVAVLPLGITLGIVAEWAAYEAGELPKLGADFAVGCVLLVCGFVAWERRPESRVGGLMSLSGLTWFLGTLFEPALFLHRGPLVHLHLSYPTGRLPTRLARAVVMVAYVDAAIEPLARNDVLTLALSCAVALTAVQVFLGTSGPKRKAGGPALAAALAFAGVLALGAVDRLAGWDDSAVVWIYDAVIASLVLVLLVDLLRERWADAVVTGLVIDLGASQKGALEADDLEYADISGAVDNRALRPGGLGSMLRQTAPVRRLVAPGSVDPPPPRRRPTLLRAKLARALGDPSLVVGYRVSETGALVDDAGRPVELPLPGSGKAVTELHDRGEQIAVLVHDETLLADPGLLESVAAAARIAVANPRLQAEARARAEELEASRRRIVEAGDAQRRRLERELRLGAERRLEAVAALLAGTRADADGPDARAIAALEVELGEAQAELREFAHGVHPAALTELGLIPALALLAERSPVPVQVTGEIDRLQGTVEAAIYFVCSEALANVTKHAAASSVSIDVRHEGGRVTGTIADDGVGGADPRRGSGLRGLADRVEALDGRLSVESPAGGGTRVVADIPIRR